IRIQQKRFVNTTAVPPKVLLASYQVSCRITPDKKCRTIAETVILLAGTDMVQTMFDEKCAQQLRNIKRKSYRLPISNNTFFRLISDKSEDLEERTIEKLRNKRFSIRINEATDCSIGHLVAYVRYVENTTINEYMLSCKLIKRRATAEELFKIVDHFIKEKAHGNKGQEALIKQSTLESVWMHCMVHRENYVKTCARKCGRYAELREGIGHAIGRSCLTSRFSKYFPEAVSDKYKWIMDTFRTNSPPNYDFSLEEELKIYLAVASIKTNYYSTMNLENYLSVAISKLQPRYDKLCSVREPHPSH
ncbi:hypothetical protein B7P43_G08930, partial [Cryptotermes secundus]